MELEYTILNYLREKEFFEKLSGFIDESMFSERGQVVLSALKELIKDCPEDGRVKCKEIHLYLTSDRSFGRRELQEYKKLLRYIRRSKVTNRNVLVGICKEFIEKNLWKDSLEKFMPFLTKRGILPLDSMEEALEQTKKIRETFGEIKGYDYFQNISRAKIRDDPRAIESPLKGIYLHPGEVGVWAGIPKRGKTWALVNTGYFALLQGKRIVHFTLEIVADWLALRYDGRTIGKPYKELKSEDSARAIKKIKSYGGTLTIEDRSELTLYEIRNYLKDRKFDMIIVDYADLVTPPKKYKERRFELVAIYQGLRKIAKEFQIPVWTASQLVSKSASKKIATIDDLEEAKIGKGGTASLVLTINQTPEEKEDSIARVFIAASNRGFPGKAVRKVEANLDTMVMKEFKSKYDRE